MEPTTTPAPKSIGELLRAAESRPIAIAAPPIGDRPPIRRERSQGRHGPDARAAYVRSAWVLFAGLVLFSLAVLAASVIVAGAVADLDAGTPATVGPDA